MNGEELRRHDTTQFDLMVVCENKVCYCMVTQYVTLCGLAWILDVQSEALILLKPRQ